MNTNKLFLLFFGCIGLVQETTYSMETVYRKPKQKIMSEKEKRVVLESLLKIRINEIRSGKADSDSVATHEKLTALHLAAFCNEYDVVWDVLALGANINAKNIDGATPLMAAGFYGHSSIVQLLLNHEADISCTEKTNNINAIHSTVKGKNLLSLKMILEKLQSYPNKTAIINHRNYSGHTPLDIAIIQKDDSAVYYLLKYGAHTNIYTDNNTYIPPLISVAQMKINSKQEERICNNMTKCLLLYKADPNGEDHNGETPLFNAVQTGKYKMVQTLLQHGADANHISNKGYIPLVLAISRSIKHIGSDPISCLLIAHTNIQNIQKLFDTYISVYEYLSGQLCPENQK